MVLLPRLARAGDALPSWKMSPAAEPSLMNATLAAMLKLVPVAVTVPARAESALRATGAAVVGM